MKTTDFLFDLPNDRIAQFPLKERSDGKLLYLNGQDGSMSHHQFKDILQFFHPGDLLVLNNTKVMPARLFGRKKTGGQVEILMERILDDRTVLAQLRVSKSPKIGDPIYVEDDAVFIVKEKSQVFYMLYLDQSDLTVWEVMNRIGHMPIPHYMKRASNQDDFTRYQTVYAEHEGSVAAPTAGLHFDRALLTRIQEAGVKLAYTTLHIGSGTFAPVRCEYIKDHVMHTEFFEISETLCERIQQTKSNGGRVIAVGTTSLRALESASRTGNIKPFRGETNIFIYPGFQFQCVDALITNLHLPSSTLLMLTAAFGGYEQVMRAYEEAISKQYRFYSYGDAMWINRG